LDRKDIHSISDLSHPSTVEKIACHEVQDNFRGDKKDRLLYASVDSRKICSTRSNEHPKKEYLKTLDSLCARKGHRERNYVDEGKELT